MWWCDDAERGQLTHRLPTKVTGGCDPLPALGLDEAGNMCVNLPLASYFPVATLGRGKRSYLPL